MINTGDDHVQSSERNSRGYSSREREAVWQANATVLIREGFECNGTRVDMKEDKPLRPSDSNRPDHTTQSTEPTSRAALTYQNRVTDK